MSMERTLRFIERLRGYPEPVRRQILWLGVIAFCLVIGAVWIVTLKWQLRHAAVIETNESRAAARQLPGIGKGLSGNAAVIEDAARDALRSFLLGDETNQETVSEQSEGIVAPQQELPRLPEAE